MFAMRCHHSYGETSLKSMAYWWPSVCVLLLFGLLSAWCESSEQIDPFVMARVDAIGAAEFAVQEYNNQSEDDYVVLRKETVRTRIQMGPGLLYYLDIRIQRTWCRKGETIDSVCTSSNEMKICNFIVWTKVWLEGMHLMSFECPATWS
ncbi:cystatin-like [Erpetoichthys calabaricus]|uniref:cystatin-like n=1 Tax=Erpetoichthys calabaricus TaxID=27687 RepID=UPI00109F6A24|nr:cystatin-like [Erpetoichthys calabaricus]